MKDERPKAPMQLGANSSENWHKLVLAYGAAEASGKAASPSADSLAFLVHLQNMARKPTLDVDVVSHCNLNCASCCHYAPIAESSYLALDTFRRDLHALAAIKGVAGFFDALCLMGGEPLLHPDLASLIRAAHEAVPGLQLRVVTNGKLLASAPKALWDAMRATKTDILMTPYPIGVDYSALVELAQAHGVEASVGGGLAQGTSGEHYFLRTPLDESGTCDPAKAFAVCSLGGSTMQLLDGRIYPCNRGALFGIVNARFGTKFTHESSDYLELDTVSSVEQIDIFRRSARPMCRYCAHFATTCIPWAPSTCDSLEWLLKA